MSQVNTNAIYDASGTSNAVLYGVAAPTNSMGFRNRIINGAMVVAQRGTAAVTAAGSFPVDRFFTTASSLIFSAQQSSVAPAGFINSILWTQTSAATITSTSQFRLAQHIEGFNIADFGWGTANAQPVTLSFWVRSSVTGSYGIGLINNANDRSYVASYTITAANTWEYKTITIAGDTTGTWLTDNGTGIKIRIDLGSGSNFQGTAGAWQAGEKQTFSGATSVATTSGATFYITGVQLEAGSVASPFERRDYGRELMMCQRYYYKIFPQATNSMLATGYVNSSSTALLSGSFPVVMRTAPTALEQSGTAGNYRIVAPVGPADCSSVPTFSSNTNEYQYGVNFTVASGLTTGHGATGRTGSTTGASGYLAWSAEL